MHVVLIGRYVLPHPFTEHRLDCPMLKDWAKHMARLDVIVQSQDDTARIWQEDNLVVHYAPGFSKSFRVVRFLLWALRRLVWIHQRDPVDVVNGSDLLGSLCGLLVRPWMGTKVIAQLQGEFLNSRSFSRSRIRAWAIRALAIYVCRHSDMVRCLYSAAAEQVVSLGVQQSRVVTIPSRCDTTLFDSKRYPKRNEMGTSLLYVGNLVPGKGLNFLLSSLPSVIQNFPSAILTIVGDGSQKEELLELVQALCLDNNVKFLGRIPHDELPSVMSSADLFVFASLSEATPRAVMEAMAMELPVVATRVGGVPEMVEDGLTGLLVDPGSPHQLAEAICRVLRDPLWMKEAGRIGRLCVQENYTLEQHVQRMVALHYHVVGMSNAA